MRKEGVILIGIGIILLSLVMNSNHLFNAFALFLLVGGIPGTTFSFPDIFMLIGNIMSLTLLTVWLFKERLPLEKFLKLEKNTLARLAKRRRYRHTAS